jgi:hypothetical protein
MDRTDSPDARLRIRTSRLRVNGFQVADLLAVAYVLRIARPSNLRARGQLLAFLSVFATACSYPSLAPGAKDVTVTTHAPPSSCERIATIRGGAGTTWPPPPSVEAWPEEAGDKLLGYAMNDLRNRAAAVGANYVHRSEPTLTRDGLYGDTIRYGEYAGFAYRCPRQADAGPARP